MSKYAPAYVKIENNPTVAAFLPSHPPFSGCLCTKHKGNLIYRVFKY